MHGILLCSDDSTEPSDFFGSFTVGSQTAVKSRTDQDNDQTHTSPSVLSSSSSPKAGGTLENIPEEISDAHKLDQQQQERQHEQMQEEEQSMQQQASVHQQVQGDDSLPVEMHELPTVQATSHPPVPISAGNKQAINLSGVTYSSHRSPQASVNPQSNVPVGKVLH